MSVLRKRISGRCGVSEPTVVKINPYEILGEMILRTLDFDEQIEEWAETSGWFRH